jgi:hypothetical protein
MKIPDPPSRSPTPPTKIVPHNGRGNKFTPEDKDFFLKFVSWRLKEDPSLTRNDLCELLAEKVRLSSRMFRSSPTTVTQAPHHSIQSWYSYWSNNHDLPDKILAAAHGEDIDEDDDDDDDESSEEEKIVVRKRPKYKDLSSSEEDGEGDENDDAEGDAASEEEEEEDDDDDDTGPLPAFDEASMGGRGEPFTDADLAITARHVATFAHFAEAPFQDKWVPYAEKVFATILLAVIF